MLTRPLLFISSYAGLFVLTMVRFHDMPLLVVCSAAAAIVGLAAPLVLVESLRHAKRDFAPYCVRDVEDRGSEVAAYLATYLLPFVMATSPSLFDLVAYLIFLGLVAIVYVQSEMVQVNPVFYLLRWRVFAFSGAGDRRFFLIAKTRPSRGTTIQAWTITDDVLVDVELGRGLRGYDRPACRDTGA
jgi:hypothetical protein